MSDTVAETTAHYCFYHPSTETELRCNRCGKYICIRDAVRTPVGYRCRDCVHSQQDIFYNALPTDYLIAAAITLPIAYGAGLIVPRLFWLAIFVGPLVGGLISEAIQRLTKKRRGRYTWLVAVGCLVVATVLAMLPELQLLLNGRLGLITNGASNLTINLIIDAIYLVLCGGTLIARLRYGK
jgi:hypothetical protein